MNTVTRNLQKKDKSLAEQSNNTTHKQVDANKQADN